VVVRTSVVALFFALLATSANVSAEGSPAAQAKQGTLEKGCRTLGVATLCFPSTADDAVLRIDGRPSQILQGYWDKYLPYEMERRGGLYRVKVGIPSTSDVPFFYYDEVTFRKIGSRYLATKFVFASSQACDGMPDLKRIDVIDFRRSTITTILEPAWTNDGKGRRYVHPIKLNTFDVRKMSEDDLTAFLAGTPANKRLCEDYA
jgi:hypothetical protein